MKKYLKRLFVISILGICLSSMIVSLGNCQELTKIEVLFSPEQGEKILQTLESAIQNAEKRVYILIYSFTLDELTEAIIDKWEEGVDVRIIIDKSQASSKWAVTEQLEQVGVPLLIMTGSKGGYMHLKVLIADDTILTGSYNYSNNATYRSDENLLIITDKEILEAHLAKFSQLWEKELPVVSLEITEAKQRAPPDITVYITDTGKKYHSLGCRYL
ncbi:unnamed protein product, partial [marine sediment metagenome]